MSSTSTSMSEGQSTGRTLLAVVGVELALGTLVILLRTYVKFGITKEAGKWSYIWALLAWTGGVIDFAAVVQSVHHGLGRHVDVLSAIELSESLKWSWVSDATCRLAGAFGRTALVAFIYEIQGPHAPAWRKRFLWFVSVSNIILNLFIVFVIFFRCSPPSFLWDKSIINGSCPGEALNQYAAYVVAGWGALSDLVMACYPISIFWVLQMPARAKVGVSVLMAAGIFACVCAIMTTYYLHNVSDTMDPTYVLTPLTIWVVTEMWVILIASSVPALWPLVRKIKGRSSSASQPPTIHGEARDSCEVPLRKGSFQPMAAIDEMNFGDESEAEKARSNTSIV